MFTTISLEFEIFFTIRINRNKYGQSERRAYPLKEETFFTHMQECGIFMCYLNNLKVDCFPEPIIGRI